MLRYLSFTLLFSMFISYTSKKVEEHVASRIEKISIFEIYLKESHQLEKLNVFFRDTLKLPVEWEPFDFFGDGVVYDAAFYLGNTTLELLALYAGDSTMTETARYNRILFNSENIINTSNFLEKAGLAYNPPFDFNIVSNNSQLTIGKQINLDSLSEISNVYIAFWEYLPAGFSFVERGVSAETSLELEKKLNSALKSNPLGIIGLKEIHLNLDKEGIEQWNILLGESDKNKWEMEDGLTVSIMPSSTEKGVAWIKIRVNDLSKAKEFLTSKNLLSTENNQIMIDRTRVYGLKIILEE